MNIKRISIIAVAVWAALSLAQPLGAAVPNAWQISDTSTTAGWILYYYTNLTTAQRIAATNSGWRYTVISRLTTDFAGTAAHNMIFGDGIRRFGVLWDLNASGHLTVTPYAFSTLTLTTDPTAATNYHVHQLIYTPATRTGTYWFNGTPIHSWFGQAGLFATNAVQWGSGNGSSSSRGEMNFYKANFEVMSLGVIASYHAGTADNPATAPNPTTQDWRLGGFPGGPISEGPVSPDSVALPPTVTTRPATAVQPNSATLNGFVFSDELATEYYFEYGATTNYGSVTATNTLPAGTLAVNVTNSISDLAPLPLYHFRAVASNSAGVVTGEDQSFSTLIQPLNAWQITDNSTLFGSTLNYLTNLTALQQEQATNAGWRFRLTGRFVDDFDGSPTMTLAYGNGVKRFGVLWDFDAAGNLTVEMLGGSTLTVLTNDADLYHTHELVYFPSNQTATYYVDGVAVVNWPGEVFGGQSGEAVWGALFSAGQGQMNFHATQFTIAETNVAARYEAGGSGIAPDPVMQGWTQAPVSLLAGVSSGPLSPDLIARATVNTLAPTSLTTNSAVLNGRVNPRGVGTAAWFEYGTTTNYGSVSSLTNLGSGTIGSNYSATVTGLAPVTIYHCRAVATNQFGTNYGLDVTFETETLGFTNVPIAGLLGVYLGSVAWADYDNDGRLDFLLTGNNGAAPVGQLWRNTGSAFANVPIAGLPGVYFSSVAWADYDNDGWLDFLLTGNIGGSGVSQLWRNTGSGFTNVPIAGLPGVQFSSVAWADYDNDGRLDFLLTGHNGTSGISQLWRNTGSGFINVPIGGLPGIQAGSVAWADYDNDGWLDFLITGHDGTDGVSQLWRNTGSGFTNVPIAGLPAVVNGSVAWADYDNDGWLDFLITGAGGPGRVSQLWRNTGSGFTNVPIAGLLGVNNGSVAWADYDNDGRLDFLLTGLTNVSTGPHTSLWGNTGSGFTNVPITGLPLVNYSSVAWADYDNDGRIDFLLTGATNISTRISQLWHNVVSLTNTLPSAPANLQAVLHSPTSLTLSWDAATDAQTPAPGLTYNLVLAGHPSLVDLASPQAALSNGFRRVVRMGGANHNRSWTFTNLPPTFNYYWSVQAVDTAFAGGPFAPTQTVPIPVNAWQITDYSTVADGRLFYFIGLTAQQHMDATNRGWSLSLTGRLIEDWGGTSTMGFLHWSSPSLFPMEWDFDASGRLTADNYGYFPFTSITILTNNPDLYHTHELVYSPATRIVTYFLDGLSVTDWPELALAGLDSIRWGALTSAGQGQMNFHSVKFTIAGTNVIARYDAGTTGTAPDPVTQGWAQSTATPSLQPGVFGRPVSPDNALVGPTVITHVPGTVTGSTADLNGRVNPRGSTTVAWFEYGNTTNYGGVSTMTNLGSARVGSFYSATPMDLAPFTTYHYRAVAANEFGTNYGTDAMFETGGFGNVPITGLPAVNFNSVAWADYDNDGRLDFLLTGTNTSGLSPLWRNTDSGFTNVPITGLPAVYNGSVAWGDYDRDGWMDFLLTGTTNGLPSGVTSSLWRNTGSTFINVPFPGLRPVAASSVAWADYDNDGRMDFLLTGWSGGSTRFTHLWRNTGSGFALVTCHRVAPRRMELRGLGRF